MLKAEVSAVTTVSVCLFFFFFSSISISHLPLAANTVCLPESYFTQSDLEPFPLHPISDGIKSATGGETLQNALTQEHAVIYMSAVRQSVTELLLCYSNTAYTFTKTQ